MAHLLVIDDEETLARNIARFLERSGHSVTLAGTLAEGQRCFAELAPDAVLLDFRLPDGTGLEFIRALRAQDAQCPIMLITGHGSIELAVDLMKAGADDLLTKPVSLAELRERLHRLLQRQREATRLRYLEDRERQASHLLVGESVPMQQLRARIDRLAQAAQLVAGDGGTLPPILITGETGVGKELVARTCHQFSLGAQAPFVEINCAAIPDQLLESELFGHEKGAFTDARERKLGLLEAADGGSLFLDELAEMALPLQAKLLKVIEDGRLRRLGAVTERAVRVRILAATNQDLEACVASGRFRADLYFRLRVLPLPVPPLRERGADIALLARRFCEQFAQRYRRAGMALSAAALERLQAHHWPGNVRELRNVIEQAVLLAAGPAIEVHDLMLPPGSVEPDPGAQSAHAGSRLDHMEREALQAALQQAGDNVSQAARLLGISRDTLRYRMEKHGLRG